MTLVLFLSLLAIFAVAVSLITEAVKKFLNEEGKAYSSNMVVLIVSCIVGAGGTALVYLFMCIPFTLPNIVCMALMAVSVWVGAMIGYDKVMQMIEQFRLIK